MKVLKETNGNQTIKIIPRVYTTSIKLEVIDESTNEITTSNPSTSISGDYLQITDSFNLKEGRFYNYNVKLNLGVGADAIIYKGKIFCSDQDVSQSNNHYYSMNKNKYKVQKGNNDYIII